MKPNGQVISGHGFENGPVLRLVQRTSIYIGEDLYSAGAEFLDSTGEFQQGAFDLLHRETGNERRESVAVGTYEFGQSVVGYPRKLRSLIGRGYRLDGRIGEGNYLSIVAEGIHRAKSKIEVK